MKIEVLTQVFVGVDKAQIPIIENVAVHMKLDPAVNAGLYFDGDSPNEKGVNVITETLIQGLLANIHGADAKNIKHKADHLEYIVTELAKRSGAAVSVWPGASAS